MAALLQLLLSLLVVEPERWVVPHLAVRAQVDCVRWTCKVTQPVLPAVDKSRGSKSAEVHDDRFGRSMTDGRMHLCRMSLHGWMMSLVLG